MAARDHAQRLLQPRRAAAARPDYVELDDDTASQPSDEGAPSADEIVGALSRMLPNQRTALILRDFRGVSRTEISDLMSLSAVSVEALLTRARASFRAELEAGEQPFVCEETRRLVEQQLDGLITVADRHSLRTHLRHCSPCSTLARAVRSSRGKLAGLLVWPVDLVSRLAAALSQAPAAVHVAAAITSTAAVATVAIPVAITNAPAAAHVEGRAAPGPATVSVARVARPSAAVLPTSPVNRAAAPAVTHRHAPAALRAAQARTHTRTHLHHTKAGKAPASTAPAAAPATAPHAVPAQHAAPVATTTSPVAHAVRPEPRIPARAQPFAKAPPSTLPAAKAFGKPEPAARSGPARKSAKHRPDRRSPGSRERTSPSTPPPPGTPEPGRFTTPPGVPTGPDVTPAIVLFTGPSGQAAAGGASGPQRHR